MGRTYAIKHKNLLMAALGDLTRRPVRTCVAILCLTAMLFPIVTALAVSEGLRAQAEISLNEGAQGFVSADRYGGNAPIDTGFLQSLSSLEGVSKAVPRIVGRTYFADRPVAIVGLSRESLSELASVIQGLIPDGPGEVLVGHGIARRFGIQPGIPFSLAANKRKVLRTSGTISPVCLWSSESLVMHIDDANAFFRIKDRASHILLYGRDQSQRAVSQVLSRQMDSGKILPSDVIVENLERNRTRLLSAFNGRNGIFEVLYLVGGVLALSALLITSGIGLKELRLELAVMKATGWRTRDLLEKVTIENMALSIIAACLAILISMAWIKGLNGIFIGQFYVAEVGLIPNVDIPSKTLPAHALAGLLAALCVTQAGGLLSIAGVVLRPPGESMG